MFSLKVTIIASILYFSGVHAYSTTRTNTRRAFFQQTAATAAVAITGATSATAVIGVSPANAASSPTILKTESGIKYAVTKSVDKGTVPQKGDIVAIEYTGYLSNGQVSFIDL